MNNQRKLIEEEILSSAKKIIERWNINLKNKKIEIETSAISRSGNNETYFSEIEFNVWKDNNIETFFSLIVFMEGRQNIQLDEIAEFIDDEIKTSIESIN